MASSGRVRMNCTGRSTSRRVQRDQETASPSAVPITPPTASPVYSRTMVSSEWLTIASKAAR